MVKLPKFWESAVADSEEIWREILSKLVDLETFNRFDTFADFILNYSFMLHLLYGDQG